MVSTSLHQHSETPLKLPDSFPKESGARESTKLLGLQRANELQMQVIVAFVMGQDVFAILPTGYGRSLCYACLPILLDDLYRNSVRKIIVVVVTPLTAIMEDQAS